MKSNPSYYFLLEKRLLNFTSKKSLNGADYLLVKLAQSNHLNIELLGGNAQFLEHHLSIYQQFSPSDATLGAFHYTAKYKQQGNVLVVHGYFDHCGNYLLSQVRREGHQATIKITKIDAALLSDIAQCYLEETLKTLMSALFNHTKKLDEERKHLLINLEEKSRQGVNTAAYLALLGQTIEKLSSHLNLLIDSSHEQAVVAQLQRQYDYLSQKSKKLHHKQQQGASVALDESEELLSSAASRSAAAAVPVQEGEVILEARLEALTKLPFVDRYVAQRSLLTKALDHVDNDKFDEMMSLINQLEQLEYARREKIIELSRTGGLETLKQLLQKQDLFLMPLILSNAAYYKHYDVFGYIFPLSKFINKIFLVPLGVEGKRIPLVSFLAIAADNEDIVFFRELLNVYKVEPVSEVICLLMVFVVQDRIDFLEAFLAAGANPNGITNRSEMMEMVDGRLISLEDDPLKELSKFNRNPLVCAVSQRKKDLVELLLKYKARTNIIKNNKLNAFMMSVMSEEVVVDKEIVLRLAAAGGHQIDERATHTGATGLYYACQYQCLPSVKVLLELGANPVAAHVSQFHTPSGETTVNVNPLVKAVTKQNLPIVSMILESNSPFLTYREIQRALIMAANTQPDNLCIPILETYYRHLAHEQAIKQYKEGNYPQVINLYHQILKYHPMPTEHHVYCYCLGSAHLQMKDYAKADETLNISLQMRKALLARATLVERAGLELLINKAQEKIKEVKAAEGQEKELVNKTVN